LLTGELSDWTVVCKAPAGRHINAICLQVEFRDDFTALARIDKAYGNFIAMIADTNNKSANGGIYLYAFPSTQFFQDALL
jgi:hypothetical protein